MEHTIQFNQSEIHYTTIGKGNAVVLLHGFTESLDIWEYFGDILSLEHKVILIDLPGHGKSECIAETHTMELMAECVKAVLDAQKVNECIMIGHSMGGYVTLAFAELYKDMIRGIGLFHSSALPDTPEGKANRVRAIEIIRSNHSNFITSFIPDLFAPENRKPLEKEISQLIDIANQMTEESIIAAQKGMMERKSKIDLLKTLDVPYLFIAGKKDSRLPFDKVIEQIAIPNQSFSLLLGDIAHMGYLEAPNKTLNAVNCFVKWVFA